MCLPKGCRDGGRRAFQERQFQSYGATVQKTLFYLTPSADGDTQRNPPKWHRSRTSTENGEEATNDLQRNRQGAPVLQFGEPIEETVVNPGLGQDSSGHSELFKKLGFLFSFYFHAIAKNTSAMLHFYHFFSSLVSASQPGSCRVFQSTRPKENVCRLSNI